MPPPPPRAVILCSVLADTSRLRRRAPKALAQRPLRMVGQGLSSPGLTFSLLWGLADRPPGARTPSGHGP